MAEKTSSEATEQSPQGQKKKKKKKKRVSCSDKTALGGGKKRGSVALAKKKGRARCPKGDRWRETMVSMSVTWLFDSGL